MAASPTSRRRPEGISLRHAGRCRSRHDEPCDCRPTYQAQVYSPRDRKTIRKTFRSLSDARAWRSEAQAALARGVGDGVDLVVVGGVREGQQLLLPLRLIPRELVPQARRRD